MDLNSMLQNLASNNIDDGKIETIVSKPIRMALTKIDLTTLSAENYQAKPGKQKLI